MSEGSASSRFCHRCGAGLAPGALFCSSCGATVVSPTTAPKVAAAVPADSTDRPAPTVDTAPSRVSRRSPGKIWVGVAVVIVAAAVAGGAFLLSQGSRSKSAADAAAVLTASDHAWGSGNFVLDCSKYEGVGPDYSYSDTADCESGEKQSWTSLSVADRNRFAALTALPSKALVLPENVVVFWDRDLVAPQGLPTYSVPQGFTVMRLVPGEGWRWGGSGGASDPSTWFGYVPPGIADAAVAAGLPSSSPSS